jgi:NADH-quinone oxidoreductase subunit C
VPILAELQRRFGDAIVETHEHRGDLTVVVARDALLAVLAHCRDDAALAFDVLMDLTAVDYLKFPGREDGPRFDVVYHLYSIAHNHRVRLKVRVDEDDARVPSAVALWPIANWLEREACASRGTRIRAGSSCTTSSWAIRCGRTIPSTAASR